MQTQLITDISQIPPIEDEWRRLAESRWNAFVSPEWFRSWWSHNSETSEPLIVAVHRDDDSLAGVMPLVMDTTSRPHAIRFAGGFLGDRFHPAAEREDGPAVAAEAMHALEREGLERNLLLLENIDLELEFWRRMQTSPGSRTATTEIQREPVHFIDLRGLDWEGYLSQRRGKFRSELRRRERVLRRDHEVTMRLATAETLEDDLGELFRLHELRWNGRSSLSGQAARETLGEFAVLAQQRGWLRLGVLEVDGKAVAASLGWRVGDGFAGYQGGFDPKWRNRSVGIVLVAFMIRSAIEEGVAEFDFLLGGENYKRGFTSSERASTTLALTPSMGLVRAVVACDVRARRIGRRLRDSRRVGKIVEPLGTLLPTRRD